MRIASPLVTTSLIVGFVTSVEAWSLDLSEYINKCEPNYSEFTVKLQYDNGDWYESCPHSYSKCPFENLQNNCLGKEMDWTNNFGDDFNYLETHTFGCPRDANGFCLNSWSPRKIYLEHNSPYECYRVLYKDQYHDMEFGKDVDFSVLSYESGAPWWDGTTPLHLTIIPYDCTQPDMFDPNRALAVWISDNSEGRLDPPTILTQQSDLYPGYSETIYCDISKNPEICLNVPYKDDNLDIWYSSLKNVMFLYPNADIHIYIPEGYDLDIPISNTEIHREDDIKYKYGRHYTQTYGKITVRGLGRISGWQLLLKQQLEMGVYYSNVYNEGYDITSIEHVYVVLWGQLLTFATYYEGTDYFAMDVSGVEVAWGSSLTYGTVAFNSDWSTGDDPVWGPSKLWDVKVVGHWWDRSDAPDMRFDGSYAGYSYLHVNDDTCKVSANYTKWEQTTILKGNAGSAVMLSGYGLGDVDGSLVDGVYVHRIVHRKDQYQGCENQDVSNQGGLVATRSKGCNKAGIKDATVRNLYVPELGNINTVTRPISIGLHDDGNCSPCLKNSYPIKNLRFEYFFIYPEPVCPSYFYDDSSAGCVQWGSAVKGEYEFFTDPAAWFYSQADSKLPCNFQGSVELDASDKKTFICGVENFEYCGNAGGTPGEEMNVEYGVNDDVHINFPYFEKCLGSLGWGDDSGMETLEGKKKDKKKGKEKDEKKGGKKGKKT